MRRGSRRALLAAIGLTSLCLFVLFLINHQYADSFGFSQPKSVEAACDCPKPVENVEKKIEQPQEKSSKVCRKVDKGSPIQRAILLYYPDHQKDYFFPEIRW